MDLWAYTVELLGQYGVWGLFFLAFIEAIIFPIPPDVLLVPMALINHKAALGYALVATAASVGGGYFGYLIGEYAGQPLLQRLARPETVDRIDALFARYGGWAVAIAGLTPIPYKVFTIASGLFKVRVATFMVASLVGRGIRFFAEAVLIILFGQRIVYFLQNRFELVTVILAVVLILVYLSVQGNWEKRFREWISGRF